MGVVNWEDVGRLTFETTPDGERVVNDRFPETIAICDELLECANPEFVDVAGDEVCFKVSNGRALYRRVEYNTEQMIGWYTLIGSVGPTDAY
jgi:hypothetical protein